MAIKGVREFTVEFSVRCATDEDDVREVIVLAVDITNRFRDLNARHFIHVALDDHNMCMLSFQVLNGGDGAAENLLIRKR